MSEEEFYPYSETLKRGGMGAVLSMKQKLIGHLIAAKSGCMVSESKLANRVGQIRRVFPGKCPETYRAEMTDAIEYLRSVGRKVKLESADPRFWISRRGGGPRW